jgi:hypothetical protein
VKEEVRIFSGLENYYGEVIFTYREGKYYMVLQNWDAPWSVEVTKAMFEEAKKLWEGHAAYTDRSSEYRL